MEDDSKFHHPVYYSLYWSDLNLIAWEKAGIDLYSSVFPKRNGGLLEQDIAWILRLKFSSENDSSDACISLYLALVTASKGSVSAKYKFTLLKGNTALHSREGTGKFKVSLDEEEIWLGVEDFLTFKELRNFKEHFGDFNLLCDIETNSSIAAWKSDIQKRSAQFHFNLPFDRPTKKKVKSITLPFDRPTKKKVNSITLKKSSIQEISKTNDSVRFNLLNNIIFFRVDEFSDITLFFQGVKFKAHKVILAQRSSVFRHMLLSEFGSRDEIFIEDDDITLETFRLMLDNIYSLNADMKEESVIPLLYAAEKYDVTSLKTVCESYLTSNLGHENASKYFLFGDFINAMTLRAEALEFIRQNLLQVSETTYWQLIVEARPDLIQQCLTLD